MISSENKVQKYSSDSTELFNLILTLNPEQHRFLFKKVKDLILKEKRAAARKDCKIPVNYIYNECIYSSFIINISRDGCFIEAKEPLSVREKILMHILLDGDDQTFGIKGEVVNVNRIGMGIEFEDLNGNLLGKIGNLLYKVL